MTGEYRLPASVATSGPIDFEAAWRSIVDDERNRWTEPETEYAVGVRTEVEGLELHPIDKLVDVGGLTIGQEGTDGGGAQP